MGSVHLRRITFQAFRAFRDRSSTRELPATGLFGIRGFNRDTGGSSGAGKSSTGLGVMHAFGCSPFAAKDQQNWHTKQPMQVELELDTPAGPALLKRGKEFSLSIGKDAPVKGAAKAVEAAIQKMTGLPPELFAALTYRQQRKAGRFLTMKDSEKKEFLGTLLGTGEMESAISEAVKSGNQLRSEVDSQTRVIDALMAQLKAPEAPQLVNTELLRDVIVEAKTAVEAAADVVSQFKELVGLIEADRTTALSGKWSDFVPPETTVAELQKQRDEVDRRSKAAEEKYKEDHYAKLLASEAKKKHWNQLSTFVAGEAQVRGRIEALEKERATLAAAKCPTCLREWEDAESRLKTVEDGIYVAQAQLDAIEQAKKQLPQVTAEANELAAAFRNDVEPQIIEQLRKIRQDIIAKIATEKAKETTARQLYDAKKAAHFAEMNAAYDERVKPIKAKLEVAQRAELTVKGQLQVAQAQMDGALAANKNALAVFERAQAAHSKALSDIVDRETKRDEVLRKANEQADFAETSRAFLGAIFDEVLVSISSETNELIRTIPNVATTTVTFTSESVNGKGNISQEIRPVIIKDGVEISMESGLSGGQQAAIELAVDLSIAKVIGERVGHRPGFMIFDEAFEGHCLPVKEACLQVLQKAAADCLILVVDHAAELRDYFTGFIDVESKGPVSRFME